VRIVLQAGSLVLLTRTFGVKSNGVLAGAAPLYLTVAQFVRLGDGIALARHACIASAPGPSWITGAGTSIGNRCEQHQSQGSSL